MITNTFHGINIFAGYFNHSLNGSYVQIQRHRENDSPDFGERTLLAGKNCTYGDEMWHMTQKRHFWQFWFAYMALVEKVWLTFVS